MPFSNTTVTGAFGFIGSHLVKRLLESGVQVTALARSNSSRVDAVMAGLSEEQRKLLEVRFVDITNRDALADAIGPGPIVHLAGQNNVTQSLSSPSQFLETNILGCANVLAAAVKAGVSRAVVISTADVYGGSDGSLLSEESRCFCRSPYAASKAASEKLAEAYYASYGLGTVIIRLFNTYGPGMSSKAVIPRILEQAKTGDTIHIGNLSPVRDFIHVDDVVKGLICAASADPQTVDGQVINLSTGTGHSIGDVIGLSGRLLARDFKVVVESGLARNPRSEIFHSIGDTAKARHLLGWGAEIPLERGLASLLEAS